MRVNWICGLRGDDRAGVWSFRRGDVAQGLLHPTGRPVAALRPRPGIEPDQDAQEPACLRPHLLPLAER